MIQIVLKKHQVTYELQGTDMSSTNKGAGTYNSKKGVLHEWKKDLEYLLGKPIHFSVKNTTNNADTWGSFSNSFSTYIGLQIHLYTSWSESRLHKFTDIGNSIFH